MGQNLGGTPCSDEPQTEQVDQIFLPTVAPSSVQSVLGRTQEPTFTYSVNAPDCEGCAVEFMSQIESFWFVSDHKDYAYIDALSHYIHVSFIRPTK